MNKKTSAAVCGFRPVVLLACFMLFFCGCEDKSGGNVWQDADEEMIKGQRQAAEDSKKLLKVKPGKRIMEPEPFFTSVWEGEHVPIPDNLQELSSRIEQGACDYVVVDNLSVRRRSPKLKPLLTGHKPLPGTGLVYRRYFRKKGKIFSVYKRGAASLKVESGLSEQSSSQEIKEALKRARNYYLEGYVEHARQLLLGIIEIAPKNALVHRELVKVYLVYGNFDGKSLDKAEDHLLRYSFLSPGRDIKPYRQSIQNIRTAHKARWGSE
ncbi:MAG: hypothetical protein R6V10_02870 [bacterium]